LIEALDMLRSGSCACDLLLCDAGDGEQEFEALHEIKREFPGVKAVLLTDCLSSTSLDIAVEGGANAMLPKDISADALHYSLELVLLGEQIFPTLQSLLKPRSAPVGEPSVTTSRQAALSTRERQILACLVDGQPNKTIARNLNMAEATVKVHLKALLRKIDAQNRTQAAIWGMNHGAPAASAVAGALSLNGH
jgi:two-component system nitrate/nitrite response regulator NarL